MGVILTTYESRDYIVTESAISDHKIKIETVFFPTRYVSSPKSSKLSYWLNDVSHCKDPDYLWSAWKRVPKLFSKIMVLWYFYHGTIKKTSEMQVQDIQEIMVSHYRHPYYTTTVAHLTLAHPKKYVQIFVSTENMHIFQVFFTNLRWWWHFDKKIAIQETSTKKTIHPKIYGHSCLKSMDFHLS